MQKPGCAQAQDRLQHVLEIDPTLTGRQVGVRVEPHQRSLYSVYRCEPFLIVQELTDNGPCRPMSCVGRPGMLAVY